MLINLIVMYDKKKTKRKTKRRVIMTEWMKDLREIRKVKKYENKKKKKKNILEKHKHKEEETLKAKNKKQFMDNLWYTSIKKSCFLKF